MMSFFGDTFWMTFFVIHINGVFLIQINDDFCDVLHFYNTLLAGFLISNTNCMVYDSNLIILLARF